MLTSNFKSKKYVFLLIEKRNCTRSCLICTMIYIALHETKFLQGGRKLSCFQLQLVVSLRGTTNPFNVIAPLSNDECLIHKFPLGICHVYKICFSTYSFIPSRRSTYLFEWAGKQEVGNADLISAQEIRTFEEVGLDEVQRLLIVLGGFPHRLLLWLALLQCHLVEVFLPHGFDEGRVQRALENNPDCELDRICEYRETHIHMSARLQASVSNGFGHVRNDKFWSFPEKILVAPMNLAYVKLPASSQRTHPLWTWCHLSLCTSDPPWCDESPSTSGWWWTGRCNVSSHHHQGKKLPLKWGLFCQASLGCWGALLWTRPRSRHWNPHCGSAGKASRT